MSGAVQRPFGFWMASALVVGGMVGSGIFVLPGRLAPYGWTGVAAWGVAIAGALVIALVMARLAAARPEETGAVAICGTALGPLAGVLVGWSYWVAIVVADAIIALTAVRYLAVFVPALGATPLASAGWAVALLWLLVLVNLRGARAAGWMQGVTTAVKLLPLVAVVAIVAALLVGGGAVADPVPRPGVAAAALTPALTLAFYALVGFESASVAAERVRDPARTVLRATLAGTALTGLLYLVVCSGIVLSLPAATVAASDAPVALFVSTFWGRAAGLATAGFAAVAAIGCLNGWVLIMGEVPLGMARAGLLPTWIGRTSRRDVPVGVLVASAAVASLLLLANLTRSTAGLLDFMLRLTTAAALWLYLGAMAAAWVLRVARPLAAVGALFALWALWGSGVEAIGYSVALATTALPLYALSRRRSAAVAAR